jgi:tRNA (Thr-GGU) A37 N-methylase
MQSTLTSPYRVLRCKGHSLYVAELDATDQTPVFNIKPIMQEFLARTPIR